MKLSRRELFTGLAAGALSSAIASENSRQKRASRSIGPVCLTDFEPLAKAKLPHSSYEFIAGGAGDEITIRWNREAYDRIALKPTILPGTDPVDMRLRLLGMDLPHPLLLAPTAFHRLAHDKGEVETARGAGAAGAVFVVSSFTTRRLSDIAKAASAPLWFQFFDLRKEQSAFIKDALQEAEGLGCRALCITVDAPTTGPRNRQTRTGFKIPDHFETPYYPDRQNRKSISGLPLTGGFSWRDLERVQNMTRLPLLLKGIMRPEDADQAIRNGAQGIMVSNHGGRCLDTLPATITVLPAIADKVAGRVPILVDGGVRRGTDVLKALALGAQAVLVGRPYLYGLSVSGSEGVTRILEILRQEFEMAMLLSGRLKLSQIDRSVLQS